MTSRGLRDEVYLARVQQLESDNHRLKARIANLYIFLYGGSWTVRTMAGYPVHPMEKVIRDDQAILESENPVVLAERNERLIRHFGMILPTYVDRHGETFYITQNLYYYARILTRRDEPLLTNEGLAFLPTAIIQRYLYQLTDLEIARSVGVHVVYQNRVAMIELTAEAFRTPTFLVVDKRVRWRSINRETISGNDVMDRSVFMFAFGTPVRYQTYELNDLLEAFYTDTETGAAVFRHPENQNLQFNEEEIIDLETFLQFNRNMPGARELRERIREIKRHAGDSSVLLQGLKRRLETFSEVDKMLVREFLKSVFYTGMYMRRWRGPGNPFPFLEEETTCRLNPEGVVLENISLGRDILERMSEGTRSFVLGLNCIQYSHSGDIEIEQRQFSKEWDDVIAGRQCIRMASTKFVGTGMFYLKEFFSEEIPGMIGPVARIQ